MVEWRRGRRGPQRRRSPLRGPRSGPGSPAAHRGGAPTTLQAEMAVRKLLIASQKGGVGKTTTSINLAAATAMAGARVLLLDADPLSSISSSLNLAQHPNRQPLRRSGLDLPGTLCCGVIPGLDVISPYDEGGCTDEDLDELLRLLAVPAFEDCYSCLVVGSPPFMGARPSQLLSSCDEFLLV